MEYTYQSGLQNMQFPAITELLRTTYWAEDIQLDKVVSAAQNSTYLAGVFDHGTQIAYARVLSDKVGFAYLMDVVIHPDYRGKGIGRLLIRSILTCEELSSVGQWLLQTRDAQEFYKINGFTPLEQPENWMQRPCACSE